MSKNNGMLAQLKQLVKKNYHPNGAVLWQHPTKPQYKVIVIEEQKKLRLRYTSPTAVCESEALLSYLSQSSRIAWGSRNGPRASKYTDLPTTTTRYQKFCNQIRSTL